MKISWKQGFQRTGDLILPWGQSQPCSALSPLSFTPYDWHPLGCLSGLPETAEGCIVEVTPFVIPPPPHN